METTPPRDSNIELLRIVFMVLIVLHHYCVNAGFEEIYDFHHLTFNTLLVQFMAFGGKVGVNGFFLISGFYMVLGTFRRHKIYRLLSEILFYNAAVVVLLSLLGYSYDFHTLLHDLTPLLFGFTDSFVASYLLVYILSPIINKSLRNLTPGEFRLLIGVLLFYFTVLDTFFAQPTWNYFGWAFTMYCTGAYIRLHGAGVLERRRYRWIGAAGSLALIWGCVVVMDLLAGRPGGGKFTSSWYFLLTQGSKPTVFLLAVCMLLIFRDLRVGYLRRVNLVAASSIGVLYIHANSDTMRQWLWRDLLDNTGHFASPWLWAHMLFSVAAVYILCTLIDIARIRLIENPLFERLSARSAPPAPRRTSD